MCMIDDGERYAVYGVRYVKKSRKLHKCYECGREIAIGELYRKYYGLFDGKWNNHPTCQHCCVACDWLVETCRGFLHGGVCEDIAEHAASYRSMSLYRLEVGMLRKWGGGKMKVPRMPQPITVSR